MNAIDIHTHVLEHGTAIWIVDVQKSVISRTFISEIADRTKTYTKGCITIQKEVILTNGESMFYACYTGDETMKAYNFENKFFSFKEAYDYLTFFKR